MASHALHGSEIFPAVPGLLDEDELEDTESSSQAGETTHQHHHLHEDAGHSHTTADSQQHSAAHAEALGFAPGSGEVEEEVIEDEEYDFEPLQAHQDDLGPDEQMEELSEQQIDAGDVGEFVRDTYVEERTSSLASNGVESEADDSTGTIEDVGDYEEPEFDESGEEIVGEFGSRERASSTDAVAPDARTQRRGRRGRRMPAGRAPRRGPMGGGGGRRQSAQSTSLPIITDLLKPGQEILVQIAKEPIAKKGARITSHIALPGRFLVYMPTVNHVGVSRKIASDEERQRLKRILLSEKGDANGGFIVRTAAGNASEQELRADIRFLINLWTEIKQRSEQAKSPALIYHDLNLVERVLRDQVTDRFSVIWVDTEEEYERVVRFLTRFQPALVRHVKLYTKETPLFEQFGIQEEINKALKSKVWLKSGGSIVINQTEALVAIDINTGKYVGKTARLEDTILKTNLDAIPEIVRQVRLRDLGGIIVIDFIDMDERRSRQRVMQALEEALKADRAPSKVLQFNDFGLVAITRKRVKQSLERTLSMPCLVCQGTGMVKNPVTVCNEIYVELRKMHKHLDRGDILLRVNPEVVKQLKANNSRWLQDMEEMAGRTIIVKSDPSLNSEQFDIQ
jgi:ribonuclease G